MISSKRRHSFSITETISLMKLDLSLQLKLRELTNVENNSLGIKPISSFSTCHSHTAMAAKLLDTKRYSLEMPAKKGRSKSWDDSATVKEFMVNERLANKFKNLVREGIPDELRCKNRCDTD